MRVVFPETVALESQVCHCFGVLAEAVLLTLRRAKMTLPGHCLSQSGQVVAHPGGFHDRTCCPQDQSEKRFMAGFPSLSYRHRADAGRSPVGFLGGLDPGRNSHRGRVDFPPKKRYSLALCAFVMVGRAIPRSVTPPAPERATLEGMARIRCPERE